MVAVIQWSLWLSVLLYAALAVWRLRIGRDAAGLAVAFAGMALFGALALSGADALGAAAVPVRDAGWTLYLWTASRPRRPGRSRRWLRWLLLAMAALVAVRVMLGLELGLGGGGLPSGAGVALAYLGAGLLFAVAALLLVHNLYFASPHASSGFQLALFTLGVLWAFDLNVAAATLLNYPFAVPLAMSRGAVAFLLAPLFGLAARRKEHWRITLSRRAAFQSLTLIALGGYFVVIVLVGRASDWLGPTAAYAALVLGAVAISALTVAFLFSAHARGWLKVFISKHLFEHRYDYRAEWLRFSATINGVGGGALSPEERAVKAVADVVEVPAGLLYLAGPDDRLEWAAHWNWARSRLPDTLRLPPERFREMERSGRVLVTDELRQEADEAGAAGGPPDPLLLDEAAWIAVPLVRYQYLVGAVVLARPPLARPLDWEDFDLLKVLGQQIASYLADAQNQAELEEARRFEEFNRRFAFIIHDVKNVVSQLSLVAANAERHGANPRFQADMAATLNNAVGKMNALLSRLSTGPQPQEAALADVDARDLLDGLASRRRAQREVLVAAENGLVLRADAENLRLALDHLIQNAVEASAPDAPVTLEARAEGAHALLCVADRGQGMSAEFLRKRLFKPFQSTKDGGFGIGAGEARSLVRAMGGDLDVESTEGVGSRFTIRLARGGAAAGEAPVRKVGA